MSLSGLNSLTSIEGNLVIDNNPALLSMSGLNKLTSIGGGLQISYNASLLSLSALSNVTSIRGILSVSYNDELTSLSGLDSITPYTISHLYIQGNPLLSICNVPSVCTYLKTGGFATIYNNASGCNDRQEIKLACQSTSVKESSSKQAKILVYPNPTSNTFTIDLPEDFNIDNTVMTVYDLYGRAVMQKKVMDNAEAHDTSNLGNGIYFVELRQHDKIFRNKLLITR